MSSFYVNNKLAFKIYLKPGSKGGWDLVSNLPKFIFDDNKDLVTKLTDEQSILKRTKEEYLQELSRIVSKDKNAHYFYFPDFLLKPCKKNIDSSVFKDIIKYSDGFFLHPNTYFSENTSSSQFHILQRQYWIFYLYNKADYDVEIKSCSRAQFEKSINSEQCKHDYVELYSNTNSFVYGIEENVVVYIVLEKGSPVLFNIKAK